MFNDKQDFIRQYHEAARIVLGKDLEDCGAQDRYAVLANLIASKARKVRTDSDNRVASENKKQVYYFSMEFLIGKLLDNYLINLGVRDMVAEALDEMGYSLETLEAEERDAGLGNGGLGRLAACFIDSLASLGYSGHGNGIRYRFGLFKQEIENGRQIEKPDNWLEKEYPWEVRKPENAVVVKFGGKVECIVDGDKNTYKWVPDQKIIAMPYDVPVLGYGRKTANNLRLWSAEPYEENFDMDAFNRGDYSGAIKYRADIEAITSILYPNDNADPGKILRLKQEYMFVAAGIATIVKEFKKEHGSDWNKFPDCVAIHTNDTHPSLCAPELMRILIDEEGLEWDQAWDIVVRTISYTNHTILPEALEKWPIDIVRTLLPRVYDFIEEIDRRYKEVFPKDLENWQEILKNTSILWGGEVRMANLSIISGHSVNGVAKLHTEILKNRVLKDFYVLTPEKFNNKTNGVTHRRFLLEANPSYSKLITSAIGEGWITDADELSKLKALETDSAFLEKAADSKKQNKIRLANYIKEETGILVDTDSIFDIQVKRFHAYKRQLLNIFKVIYLYDKLTTDSSFDIAPSTFIFAGKAAQGYDFAKDVIRLVNSVAHVVNNDPKVKGRMRVAFVPNFAVSNAQYIYPAADISEQISTAGMEASGTGNMKFMMNGAITLGTLDGANVEISEQVGMDNISIFGLRTEQIEEYRKNGNYFAMDEYNRNPALKKVVDQLTDGTFAELSGNFNLIYDTLMHSNDEFFVLKDFRAYVEAWHGLEKLHGDKSAWGKISLHNTACSGFFSSDRTIKEYAEEVWGIK